MKIKFESLTWNGNGEPANGKQFNAYKTKRSPKYNDHGGRKWEHYGYAHYPLSQYSLCKSEVWLDVVWGNYGYFTYGYHVYKFNIDKPIEIKEGA
jgi:hypothetical protein